MADSQAEFFRSADFSDDFLLIGTIEKVTLSSLSSRIYTRFSRFGDHSVHDRHRKSGLLIRITSPASKKYNISVATSLVIGRKIPMRLMRPLEVDRRKN